MGQRLGSPRSGWYAGASYNSAANLLVILVPVTSNLQRVYANQVVPVPIPTAVIVIAGVLAGMDEFKILVLRLHLAAMLFLQPTFRLKNLT